MANVINILSTAGGDWNPLNLYDAFTKITGFAPGASATHFVTTSTTSTTSFDTTGSGFTFGPSGITGGTYTKSIFKVGGVAIVDFNYNPGIGIVALGNAVAAYNPVTHTGRAALDALFSTQPTTINGNIGNDILYGLNNIDTINGGAGNDILVGGGGADILNPGITKLDANGFGFELLIGNAGNDTFHLGTSVASHYQAVYEFDGGPSGITANLATNTIKDTFGNTDSVVGFVFVTATNRSDTLIGDVTNDFFAPGGGVDTINGGAGFDELEYYFVKQFNSDAFTFTKGITVNQTGDNAGTVIDPFNTIDTFINMERIAGTRFADTPSTEAPSPIHSSAAAVPTTSTAAAGLMR
jgi:Ca2+-binding RTX toxin-like protein